jgi:hypothetical protein
MILNLATLQQSSDFSVNKGEKFCLMNYDYKGEYQMAAEALGSRHASGFLE